MVTYEHTPREKWLFLYPAQVALAGTQIWWTSEVSCIYTGRKGHLWICLGECGLRATGGGIRECVEGLLQEADRAAQHAHCLPPGIPQQGGAPEGYNLFVFHPHFNHQVMTICTIDVHSRDVVGGMIR